MFDKNATGPSKPGEKFDIMYIIVKKGGMIKRCNRDLGKFED